MDFIVSDEAAAAVEAVARIATDRDVELTARSPWRGEVAREDAVGWERLASAQLVVDDAHGSAMRRSCALGCILRGATAAGVASAAVAAAVAYSHERHQFGQAIGAFQAVQHRLADMHIDARFVDGALHCALDAWVAG